MPACSSAAAASAVVSCEKIAGHILSKASCATAKLDTTAKGSFSGGEGALITATADLFLI